MYYGSRTGSGRCCICAGQTLQCVHSPCGSISLREITSWLVSVIVKVWRRIENPSASIDAYLLVTHSCQISSRSDLKRRSFRLFLEKWLQQAQGDDDDDSNDSRQTCSWLQCIYSEARVRFRSAINYPNPSRPSRIVKGLTYIRRSLRSSANARDGISVI